jgi:hypothetical protein
MTLERCFDLAVSAQARSASGSREVLENSFEGLPIRHETRE